VLFYGKRDELLKAVEEEIAALESLNFKKLNKYIEKKINLLKQCLNIINNLDSSIEYQIIVIDKCEVIPL